MMLKRRRPQDEGPAEAPLKRRRQSSPDRLSGLSDELLLRVFANLSAQNLVHCERLSRRLQSIAGDSQLWKSLYYDRFVRPRASRIPGIRDQGAPPESLLFSSRGSKWLDDEGLVRDGKATNWKRQYKLRHNWSSGSCDVSEIPVAEQSPTLPLVAQLHEGVIITADQAVGLRAWSITETRKLISTAPFDDDGPPATVKIPTSLAINVPGKGRDLNIAVGFADGNFSIYQLDATSGKFRHRYSHSLPMNGSVAAIAISGPYVVILTDQQRMSLYCFQSDWDHDADGANLSQPPLLASLNSHTTWPPSSLSIRLRHETVIVSIAYALPTYASGWSVGLQELQFSRGGGPHSSRLASAIQEGFVTLSPPSSPARRSTSSPNRHSQDAWHPPLTRPTSLSYSHPYLLAAHPDNTLTLYMVHSSAEQLSISSGNRLWGHTSAVSGAYVGSRGRAVSVSSRGDELRIWELEGGIASSTNRRKLISGQLSVKIQQERRSAEDGSDKDAAPSNSPVPSSGLPRETGAAGHEPPAARGWIGFDDERVVLLRRQELGHEALVIYDFT